MEGMRAHNCWYIDWVKPRGMRGRGRRGRRGERRAEKANWCWAAQQNPDLRQSWAFLALPTILSHVCGCITKKLIGPCSMSGMLSCAAVVLSQNTPLWGCSYMQRHLSGQQRGRTAGGLWLPSCHLWAGCWPWNSLWYTERPGKRWIKVKLLKRRRRFSQQKSFQ